MRTIIKVRDIEMSLYRLRVSKGKYLKDIPYESLCVSERMDLLREAKMFEKDTALQLRLVRRKGRFVWRFVERDDI